MSELGGKMARGAAWMILFRVLDRTIGVISMLILARLLVPGDFGLVAMAMSVFAIIELLGEFSFELAIIQNQNAEKRHYNTAWSFNVVFGVVASLIFVALAGPTSAFFQEPRLVEVIYLLAISMFVRGFQNIGIVDFQKELRFNKDFLFLFSRRIVTFLVTLGFALWLRNYWALVAGIVLGNTFATVLSFVIHPYRPKLQFDAAGELFDFSKWLLANNLLFFALTRSADFIVGRIAGARALGLYKLSYELSNVPTTELIMPITRAVFPGYAKMAHDIPLLRKGYLDVVALVALIAVPVGVGIASVAVLAVPVLLGQKWLDAIPLVQVLALVGAVNVLQANIGSVYLAIGKPRIVTYLMLVRVGALIPLLIIFTKSHGVTGAAFSVLVSSLVVMPVSYAVMLRTLRLNLFHFLSYVWRPLVAAAVMAGVVYWQFAVWPIEGGDTAAGLLRLLAASLLGALVYFLTVLLLWLAQGRPAGAETITLDKLRGLTGRVSPS